MNTTPSEPGITIFRKGTPCRLTGCHESVRGKVVTILRRCGFAYEVALLGGSRIWCNDTQLEEVSPAKVAGAR